MSRMYKSGNYYSIDQAGNPRRRLGEPLFRAIAEFSENNAGSHREDSGGVPCNPVTIKGQSVNVLDTPEGFDGGRLI